MKRTSIWLMIFALLGVAPAAAESPEAKQAPKAKQAQDKQPKVIRQAADGELLLHARDVVIHGTTVRYEPQPHKNTVGYWTRLEDWVSWDFELSQPGAFQVEILQGCGKGSGGAEVEFSVGGQTLKTTVKDTGGFQNFVPRDIGEFRLEKPGRYTLSVKPTTKPGVAVMDLRQVKLTPVKK